MNKHFLKKEVSKKKKLCCSIFSLLLAFCMLQRPKMALIKAFKKPLIINYHLFYSTWQVPNPFQTWKRDWRTPGPKSWQFYPPKLKPIKIHEDEIPRRKLDLHGPKIPSSFFPLVSPISEKRKRKWLHAWNHD